MNDVFISDTNFGQTFTCLLSLSVNEGINRIESLFINRIIVEMLQLKHISTNGLALQAVIGLFKEYANELNENLCFQSFDEELINPLLKYSKPNGSLFVAMYNTEIVGCVALTDITAKSTSHQAANEVMKDDGKKVCEMKRLYVKPTFRKHKIGDALVEKIIAEARALEFDIMKLDTLEKLQPAIQLYLKHGFVMVNAYYQNPLPNVVYMQLNLK